MFALNLLGGAALHGVNGPVGGKAAHKRRMALLAVLAVARGRTVGRERLIGLLWSEHRTAAARHLLSESLYVLRKELGPDAFVTAGDEVGLNGAVVNSDVEEFEGQAEQGRLEAAAQLYRGPFLDGFFIPGEAAFEQWAEAERARLARVHSRALECLAEAREAEGRPEEAAEWWRRLTVLDPSNTRVGMRLMEALDAAGERGAALWFAQSHVAYLHAELGVEPEDDFLDLVERLKTEPVRVPRPARPRDGAIAAASPPAVAAEEASGSPVHGGSRVEVEEGAAAADRAEPGEAPDPVVAAEVEVLGDAHPGGAPDSAPASASRARPGRAWRRVVRAAAAAGVLAGAVLAFGRARDEPPPVPGGYDPRRVAVLYLDDDSRGGELGYLAAGLTESLIRALSQVPALEVVSRNGVKPYRQGSVPFDRMVDELRAGTVVEGSVRRAGDSVRVTAVLVDPRTQARVESRTLTRPVDDVFALQDALADSVAAFLRRRVGAQVHLRRTGAETRSATAWRLLHQAGRTQDDAEALLRADDPLAREAAVRMLGQADSLLAVAERADPGWTRPTVRRGWLAMHRARLTGSVEAGRRAALALAGRALERRPSDPLARELRGSTLFQQALDEVGGQGQAARVAAAERDLRAAVAADSSLASAWHRLSHVLRYQGRAAEAIAVERRALAEDAWLEGADGILNRLYFGALYAADYAQARELCAQGGRRFPADWRFVECRLTLMRADPAEAAGPAAVNAVLGELHRVDPPQRARAEGRTYSPVFRLAVAAGVLARAGRTDSARAMLARARREAGTDPDMRVSLAYDEAIAYLLLGHPDSARAVLEWSFTRRPAQRAFAARDPLLRALAATRPADGPAPTGVSPPRPPRSYAADAGRGRAPSAESGTPSRGCARWRTESRPPRPPRPGRSHDPRECGRTSGRTASTGSMRRPTSPSTRSTGTGTFPPPTRSRTARRTPGQAASPFRRSG
jgi:DNA-binding SARP family transcriptional activator/TolB-like protein